MILESLEIPAADFAARTGWQLKPEGACKGDVCIPLSAEPGETVDVRQLAQDMNLPLAAAPEHGLWALGPESIGARALVTAEAPELTLPDLNGTPFPLSSLRGRKVLLYAWAPY